MPRYTEDDLSAAISAVEDGSSIRRAASTWNVPFSTLQARIKSGQRPKGEYEALALQKLSPVQESHLAAWILAQEALGVPVNHAQIRTFADRVLQASGSQERVGKHWLSKFYRRHPSVKTKRVKRIDVKRLEGATTEVIRAFFRRLVLPVIKDVLPDDRANMDETGIMEGQGLNGLCVGKAETKTALAKHPESRIWTTILECVSATGRLFDPLVIFKGKELQQQWFPDNKDSLAMLGNWKFTTSENGWTSNDIALEWLLKVYLPIPPVGKKRLLIVDGHGSHATDDFMWNCYINDVYLLYLPPHCSHVLQPLDLSFFSPLKTVYRKELQDLVLLRGPVPFNKRDFLKAYGKARRVAGTSRVIRAGWVTTGLWPINVEKPLGNSLVLKADQEAQKKTDSQQKQHEDTAQLPQGNPHSFARAVETPHRSQEVHKLLGSRVGQLQQLYRADPVARVTFSKIGKSLDDKTLKIAEYEQKIQALEAEVERLRPRKRKRVQMDLNERFAGIADIIRAKEAAGRALMPDVVASSLVFEDMCFEWAITDLVVNSQVDGGDDLHGDGSEGN